MKLFYFLAISLIISGCANIQHTTEQPQTKEEKALLAKLDQNPNDIYTVGALGDFHKNAFFEKNNPKHGEKALSYYERFLELSPNHLGALLLSYEIKYSLYLHHGKTSKASLTETFESIPFDNRAHIAPPPLAELFRDINTAPLKVSEERLKQLSLAAIKQSPKNPTSYVLLSGYHMDKEQYPTAIALLKRGLKHQPESVLLLENLGSAYVEQAYLQACNFEPTKHWENAEKYYSQAKKLNPKNPNLRTVLSEIYLSLNKIPLALYEAKAAYDISQNEDTFLNMLNVLVPSDQPEKMLALIESQPELGKVVTTTWYAEDMMQFGMWEKSLSYFKEVMNDPSEEHSIYTYIQASLIAKKVGSDWQPSEQIKPLTENHWQKQLLAFWQGELSADQLLTSAHDRCKKTEAHTYIGFTLLDAGNVSQAKYHLEKALEQGVPRFVEFSLAKHLLEEL